MEVKHFVIISTSRKNDCMKHTPPNSHRFFSQLILSLTLCRFVIGSNVYERFSFAAHPSSSHLPPFAAKWNVPFLHLCIWTAVHTCHLSPFTFVIESTVLEPYYGHGYTMKWRDVKQLFIGTFGYNAERSLGHFREISLLQLLLLVRHST